MPAGSVLALFLLKMPAGDVFAVGKGDPLCFGLLLAAARQESNGRQESEDSDVHEFWYQILKEKTTEKTEHTKFIFGSAPGSLVLQTSTLFARCSKFHPLRRPCGLVKVGWIFNPSLKPIGRSR